MRIYISLASAKTIIHLTYHESAVAVLAVSQVVTLLPMQPKVVLIGGDKNKNKNKSKNKNKKEYSTFRRGLHPRGLTYGVKQAEPSTPTHIPLA